MDTSQPPPVRSSNVISPAEYKKKRDEVLEETPRFEMLLSGRLCYDELDDLIQDMEDNGLTVDSVMIVTEEDSEVVIPANDTQ